jgi:hypothetical protein
MFACSTVRFRRAITCAITSMVWLSWSSATRMASLSAAYLRLSLTVSMLLYFTISYFVVASSLLYAIIEATVDSDI